MKKPKAAKPQQQVLRDARDKLDLTTEALAGELGVSLKTVRSWLEPATSASHRAMPKGYQLLLDRILAERKAKGKR